MSEPPSSAPRLLRLAPADSAVRGASLSPELEAAAARRLGALALAAGCFALVLGTLVHVSGLSAAIGPRPRLLLLVVDVSLSLGLYAAIATGRLRGRRALAVGLAFQVAHGFLASAHFYAVMMVPGAAVRGWTPCAVWALVFPLIVPTAPRRVWITTPLTAAMDPLALWIVVQAGASAPPPAELAHMFAPTVVVCFLAPVAASIVYGLTVEVKRAQDMGSYQLIEKLGQGGMGEVWRAEHRMLARGAAIKLIRAEALGGDGSRAREAVKRFEREAQATAALRSPHTIEVYDYGVGEDGTFHYVMELLDGYSFQALVDRFGPQPAPRVVRLLLQACHSLAEAHAAGLVHRDVKPANLFVCRLGLDVDFVKVLDFGLVKLQGPQSQGAEALTMEGGFAGTPAYMPPEVALATAPVDGRADIYALGCVAYWLLTGKRVFEGKSAMDMVIDHVRTPPVPPSKRTEKPIPEALERLVLRCLEKEASARPATAGELAAELQALALDSGWSEHEARDWWRSHPPTGGAPATAGRADDSAGGMTQSQVDSRAAPSGGARPGRDGRRGTGTRPPSRRAPRHS
jgi:serine/threonine-protein kinase